MATSTLDHGPTYEAAPGAENLDLSAIKEHAIRDNIRRECRDKLLSCAKSSATAFNLRDANEYMEMGLTEEQLTFAKSETEKTKALQKYLDEYIPIQVEQAKKSGEKVLLLLNEARAENAISLENMAEWKERMKSGRWPATRDFIDETLPKYVLAWKQVAADRRKFIQDPRIKELPASLIKKEDLATFLSGKDFLNCHYEKRVHLVGMVKAALTGMRKGPKMSDMLANAKRQLEGAVTAGILSSNKVGMWMKRIAEHEDDPQQIEDFITGKGSHPLSVLMKNWSKVRGKFDRLEERRAKEGVPPNFRFVSVEVFLDWTYEKRETYVEQADQRFEAYKNDPDEFLKIRHAFDAKDWGEAEELLTSAEGNEGEWSESQKGTLRSLRKYYEAHAPKDAQAKNTANESPNPNDVLASMRGALEQIPYGSVRNRFERALTQYDYQTLWALCTMYYNWEWCRVHGYSSDDKDAELRKGAKERTYDAMGKAEQDRGHVDYDLTTNTSVEVVRKDADTRSAQAWHVDQSTDNGQLLETIDQVKDTRAVWYWTRIMEKNIPFEAMQHLIHDVFPVLKKGRRHLDKLGVNFSLTGNAQYKSTVKAKQEPAASESSFALAA